MSKTYGWVLWPKSELEIVPFQVVGHLAWGPLAGWRFVLSLSCVQLNIPLALSESVNNICLYGWEKFVILRLVICQRLHAPPTALASCGDCREQALCLSRCPQETTSSLIPPSSLQRPSPTWDLSCTVIYGTLTFTHFQGTTKPSSLG